jgi:hypothetical protein
MTAVCLAFAFWLLLVVAVLLIPALARLIGAAVLILLELAVVASADDRRARAAAPRTTARRLRAGRASRAPRHGARLPVNRQLPHGLELQPDVAHVRRKPAAGERPRRLYGGSTRHASEIRTAKNCPFCLIFSRG